MIEKLSPLASKDSLYLAAETALDTYTDIRFTSDHMAVLGAEGILPKCNLVREDYMKNTLEWIWITGTGIRHGMGLSDDCNECCPSW